MHNCIAATEFVCFWRDSPHWARTSLFMMFLHHTQRRITIGRTLLDEWSALRKDFYLSAQPQQKNIHAIGGIRTHNLSRRAAADLNLRQRGHRDRERYWIAIINTQTQRQVFYKNGGFCNSCGQAKSPRESSATPTLENQISYIWNRLHILLFVMT